MFVVTVGIGVAAVAAIALAPAYASSLRLRGSAALGVALVAGAVGIAAVCAMSQTGHSLFLAAFILLLAGALLVLADNEDEPPDNRRDDPPWWPEFESGFRAYERRCRRPAGTR